jgi:hypothetical protein
MNGGPSDFRERDQRPCWYCRWWAGVYAERHSLCDRPNGNRVQANPRGGCAFWEREPGSDDDAWEPVSLRPLDLRHAGMARAEGGGTQWATPTSRSDSSSNHGTT